MASIAYFKAIIWGEEGQDLWDVVAARLRDANFPNPETRAEVTAAAKFLAAQSFGVTVWQLDEALSPRTARLKNR